MDILVALDEMKSMKSRHANVSVDAMLEALQRLNEQKERKLLEEEEEEAYVKAVFQGQKKAPIVRRINDEDIDDDEDLEFFHRAKVPDEHLSKPTHILTKNSGSNNQGNAGADSGKPVLKTPPIIKKKSSTIGVENAAATSNTMVVTI